jgi:hypothetical protein
MECGDRASASPALLAVVVRLPEKRKEGTQHTAHSGGGTADSEEGRRAAQLAARPVCMYMYVLTRGGRKNNDNNPTST